MGTYIYSSHVVGPLAMPCDTPWGAGLWAHDLPPSERDQLASDTSSSSRPSTFSSRPSTFPEPQEGDDFDWEEVQHCRAVSRSGPVGDLCIGPSLGTASSIGPVVGFAPSSYATPASFGNESGVNENPRVGEGLPQFPQLPQRMATPSMRHNESAVSSSSCSLPSTPVVADARPMRAKPFEIRRKSVGPAFIQPSVAFKPVFQRSLSLSLSPGPTSLSPRPNTGDIKSPPSRSGRALAHGKATRKVRGIPNQERGQNCNIMVLAS